MKKMIAALVLVTAMVSPVMAEQENVESGLPNSGYTTFSSGAYGAYASTPAQTRSVKRTRTHVEMAPETNVQQNQSDLIDR